MCSSDLLVKECLLEILSDGLGSGLQESVNRGHASQPRQHMGLGRLSSEQHARLPGNRNRPVFDPNLDTPIGNRPPPTSALKEAIKREAGGNSVLADILADTAATTLQAQLNAGDGGPSAGSMSPGGGQEQFHGNPDEVFGPAATMRADGSSHWADLAFAPSNKKSA